MKFLPLTRQVQLENSNPERLVAASPGTYFYRVGNDLFYLITNGEARRIEFFKRGFALKYQNQTWFPTIQDSDIVFQHDHELWYKTGNNAGTIGWTFISYKSLEPLIFSEPIPTATPTPTPTPTATPILSTGLCGLNLNSVGGDAGYDVIYDVSSDFVSGGTINVSFNAQAVKDQLILFANGSVIVDTGCISGIYSQSISILSGTTTLRVQVIPDCEEIGGTLWTLSITCAYPY